MAGAIYSLSFAHVSRLYIGSACNLRTRIAAHMHLLRKGTHHSPHLQRAVNKIGLAALQVTVLEHVEKKENLIAREQWWMDANVGNLYNAAPKAESRLGMKMPASARAKISASLAGNQYRLGIPHDASTKARLSASLKRCYREGRHRVCTSPENLAAHNAAVKRGETQHPSRNPARDAAIVASHKRTHSLKKTGAEFNLTAAAVWCVVRRCQPNQLRTWKRKARNTP